MPVCVTLLLEKENRIFLMLRHNTGYADGYYAVVPLICTICHYRWNPMSYNILRGKGCPQCAGALPWTLQRFLEAAIAIHGNKYNYSVANYINHYRKIKIICPEHGEFEQLPSNHLSARGCKMCGNNITQNKNKKLLVDFITNAELIHGNKYDYSGCEYHNNATKINIKCLKHGIFKQEPNTHLKGHGCPICNESKGESIINKFLTENKIKFIPQKRFKECKDIKTLPFDFYLPYRNICVEYQGIQHFKSIEYWGGIEGFKSQQRRDKIKKEYCLNNNIPLVIIKYNDDVLYLIKHL